MNSLAIALRGTIALRAVSTSAALSKRLREQAVPLRPKKAKGTATMSQAFVDCRTVQVVGGNGGHGSISLLSLFANEFAGPAGGNGGNGGHVIFKASGEVTSLNHLKASVRAQDGVNGGGKNLDGKNAPNRVVLVPVGTAFRNTHTRQIVGQLLNDGELFLAAKGGAGGKGNAHFKSAENQTPKVAEAGGSGEKFEMIVGKFKVRRLQPRLTF